MTCSYVYWQIHSMKKLLFIFPLAAISVSGFSQSAEDSVKSAVNKLFKAMIKSDANALLECFGDSAVLQTIVTNADGKTVVMTEDVKRFAQQIGSLEQGAADERIVFSGIKIDANLAIVCAPYRFYYKKNFVHCGVNSFNLVRFNGKWKIQYILDTRRKDNCL